MLKKIAIERIASLLKIDAEQFTTALTASAETDIVIADDLEVVEKAALETRDKNKYREGKKAGEEMLVKDIKKDNGIDIGSDDVKKVIDAIVEKAKKDTAKTPDARVTELEETLTVAKNNLKKISDERDRLQLEKQTIETDAKLLAHFPQNTISALTKEEILSLLKQIVKIEMIDGKETVLKDGQPVVHATSLEPLPVKDAIGAYFKERNWIQPEQSSVTVNGRGGGNSNPAAARGKYSRLSEVQKDLEQEGIDIKGEKANQKIQAAIKDNPDMDMNS